MPKKLDKFIPFGQPKISNQEIKKMADTLKSGWIGMGPKVLDFEKAFKKYIGAKHAMAFNSCTAALHLSLLVLGVKKGDEVITSPLTYTTTGNVILYLGAKPVFCDVDLETYNIDPEKLAEKITKKTKAIIPVHFGGLSCEMDKINRIAKKYKLAVIEDAAHAIGSRYHKRMIGNSRNYTCFSFYPNKNITSCEGGILSTNNGKYIKRLKILRTNGVSGEVWGRFKKRNFLPDLLIEPGYKYNLTDLQATLGLEQLKKIEKWQNIREGYAKIYDSFFKKIPGVFLQYRPRDKRRNRHSLHLYTLRIEPERFKISRNQILKILNDKNIGAVVHYIPLHLQPFYKKKFGYRRGDFPQVELITDNIFTIPLTPHLSFKEIRYIGKTVKDLFEENRV